MEHEKAQVGTGPSGLDVENSFRSNETKSLILTHNAAHSKKNWETLTGFKSCDRHIFLSGFSKFKNVSGVYVSNYRSAFWIITLKSCSFKKNHSLLLSNEFVIRSSFPFFAQNLKKLILDSTYPYQLDMFSSTNPLTPTEVKTYPIIHWI